MPELKRCTVHFSARNGIYDHYHDDGIYYYAKDVDAEIARLQANNRELEKEMQSLLCYVNAVTVFHRHGNKIPAKKLDELANKQIEVEALIQKNKEA